MWTLAGAGDAEIFQGRSYGAIFGALSPYDRTGSYAQPMLLS